MNVYTLVERSPTIEEYLILRKSVGWEEIDIEGVEIALQNSLFSVCILYKDKVIGCGRVVGDGGIYFYVQDVIVLPEFQRKGIGKLIMDSLMNYLNSNAPGNAFIGLMAARETSSFYEQYGFTIRDPDRPGMFKIWKK